MGIVFSVVLVMVQMGLFFGFGRMLTTMIDHASADLWIVSSGAKYFEDLSLLDTGMRTACWRSMASPKGADAGRVFRLEPCRTEP